MNKLFLKAEYTGVFNNKPGVTIKLDLELLRWEEDGIHYILSPVLDLTGYGYSVEEAKASFETILEEYIRYTHNKKTFFDDLEAHGWAVNRKKIRLVAPQLSELLEDNEELKEILAKKGLVRESAELALA